MKTFTGKKIPLFLLTIFLFNLLFFVVAGSTKVSAGFFDDYKGGILTIIKGMIMLWLINLMRQHATGDGNDDIITSTIKKGLNIGEEQKTVTEETDEKGVQIEEIREQETLTGKEEGMLLLINRAREDQGLDRLNTDPALVELARKKARDIVENEYFDHYSPVYGTPFDMLKEAGIEYALAGENLAKADTVDKAFKSLMNSEEHRDNILKSRYDRIGIGVVSGGDYGLVVVQLFVDSPEVSK